ncbi:SPFH domain-containing protein [Thermocoleostomius sinensis]|jgi:regulator of protease activity HflC (stomatin/prohibitin superfamily)|uniref:SPFH domain-containing protein n=1 Tax=Thermocoleostomius sinensis A174 TaxID=2016057 RepID=A0A9E8Z9Z8_9CYAN|nr:SPFH domain-containing protein [Thermocoleostomius sinensis]WAL59290.1 SPFH domain-containing protein [Thermocoleostomius sinensis A174]
MNSIREKAAWSVGGFRIVPLVVLLLTTGGSLIISSVTLDRIVAPATLGIGVAIVLGAVLLFQGFFLVQPNQAQVLVFLGRYVGSVREPGFYWTLPLLIQQRLISLRVRNFNSEKLKVNDAQGSPIEIAAVVVWRVVDSAKAIFDVESYSEFVAIQSETAIRSLASRYSYDIYDLETQSLRGNPDEVADVLKHEVQTRLEVAGVEVVDARITHLAYAPEIAQAMLRRQQAVAVIAAKERIVEGAMGMVEMALHRLSEQRVVDLDEERKAAMVNNLLVALVSESATQPIINTGTLYT